MIQESGVHIGRCEAPALLRYDRDGGQGVGARRRDAEASAGVGKPYRNRSIVYKSKAYTGSLSHTPHTSEGWETSNPRDWGLRRTPCLQEIVQNSENLETKDEYESKETVKEISKTESTEKKRNDNVIKHDEQKITIGKGKKEKREGTNKDKKEVIKAKRDKKKDYGREEGRKKRK